MKISTDIRDRKQATIIFAGIVALLIVIAIVAVLSFPAISEFSQTSLEPGVGLKTAAIASFVVTLITLVIMAVAAGDGLIGEIQYMLVGFFGFFLVLWFLIAWIF